MYTVFLKENDNYQIYCAAFVYKNKTYSLFKGQDTSYFLILKIYELMCNTKANKEIFYIHDISLVGMILVSELSKHNMHFDFILDEHTLYGLTIFFKEKKIILRCSYHLIPLSLKKIIHSLSLGTIFTQPTKFIAQNNLS